MAERVCTWCLQPLGAEPGIATDPWVSTGRMHAGCALASESGELPPDSGPSPEGLLQMLPTTFGLPPEPEPVRCPIDGAIMDRLVLAVEPDPWPVHGGSVALMRGRVTAAVDTCRRCEWEDVWGHRAHELRAERRHSLELARLSGLVPDG